MSINDQKDDQEIGPAGEKAAESPRPYRRRLAP